MKKIATYKNGNTYTSIYDDGTKIHMTLDDEYHFDFPEAHDITISQKCDNGCEFCYAGCSSDGEHGKLTDWKFFDTMRPYTEIAINLQFPIPPDLMEFLYNMKARDIIVNVTINQRHFMSEYGKQFIAFLVRMNLIHGIGISLVDPTMQGFIDEVKKYPNAVIHAIAGVINPEDIGALADKDLKLLILGYKKKNRGIGYYDRNMQEVDDNIVWLESGIMELKERFLVTSFDNLALEQLNIKDKISVDDWDAFYAGEDGTVTFFLDLVHGTFARSSLSTVTYSIGDKTIDEMFEIVKKELTDEAEELS